MLARAGGDAGDRGRRARATAGGRGCCPGSWRCPLYWPLGAVAAWRAIAEVFYAPFYWHKTEHGLDLDRAALRP